MTKNFLIPYETKETDDSIIYSTELWNWINDGIIVYYDKKRKIYTDGFQTDFELECQGFNVLKEKDNLWLINELLERKGLVINIQKDSFEIISRKQTKANDTDYIYQNAMAQYSILEIFKSKMIMKEKN